MLENGTNAVTLYAIWERDIPTMQNFKCSSLASSGDSTTLIDTRDNQTYSIAKLQDGLCWMTQNLAIGSNSTTTTLKPADSDVASDFTLPKGTNAKSTASDKSETGGWHSQQYDTKRIWISTVSGKNYGGYYSWFAATAGEGTSSKSSGDTEHSICPKGWRLPTSAEITTLTSGDNSSSNKANGKFDVYAGYCGEAGCPHSNGSYGTWWPSTAHDNSRAYHLSSYSSSFFLNYDHRAMAALFAAYLVSSSLILP